MFDAMNKNQKKRWYTQCTVYICKFNNNNNECAHDAKNIYHLKPWYSDFCEINMNEQNSLIPEHGAIVWSLSTIVTVLPHCVKYIFGIKTVMTMATTDGNTFNMNHGNAGLDEI